MLRGPNRVGASRQCLHGACTGQHVHLVQVLRGASAGVGGEVNFVLKGRVHALVMWTIRCVS
jgi:hypothetical protein